VDNKNKNVAIHVLTPKRAFFFALLLLPVAITAFITYRSTNFETGLVEESLYRQAEMISRGLEASMNIGMMHADWTRDVLQDILNANINESGAKLIYLSSPDGLIASSSGSLTIQGLPAKILPGPDEMRIPQRGVFLKDPDLYVFRKPVSTGTAPAGRFRGMGGMMMRRAMSILPEGTAITVVLDAEGASFLKRNQVRVNLITAFFLLMSIAGIAGWGFWSQRARETALALSRTRSYAAEIVMRMPAGLIVCGIDGKISVTNPGAAQILGMPEESLAGRSAQSISPPQILPCESLRQGKEHPVTEGTMELNGRHLRINLSATPIPGEGEESGGFLILFQDISEMESLKDQLARSERLAEIGELSSTVAHEIRNPLSSIRGLAQLLSGKVPEEQRSMTTVIMQEVERLNRVVSGLLSYARHEDLYIRVQEVGDLLRHAAVLAEGDARIRDVELKVELNPAAIQWPLDRDLVIQAILNLLINSIEASSAGQTVLVTAEAAQDGLWLRVVDKGAGVPEDSEKLFSLLETTKESGTGLGLPLVRKVAQLHGGSADIRRREEGGSVAVIFLPGRGED